MFFTEFAFVSAGMVELFNFVMGVWTVEILTAPIGGFFALDMSIIFEVGSPSVNRVVVEETEISVMFF